MPEYSPGAVNFPIIDAGYDYANQVYNREVISEVGYVEPHISEIDDWCTMPVRVVVDAASGIHIEVGPYGLDAADVRMLQNAIRAYYENINSGRLRVIDGNGESEAKR